MFELVEQQPSHLACPDVLNLSLGESRGPRVSCWGAVCLMLPSPASPGPVLLTCGLSPRCNSLGFCEGPPGGTLCVSASCLLPGLLGAGTG